MGNIAFGLVRRAAGRGAVPASTCPPPAPAGAKPAWPCISGAVRRKGLPPLWGRALVLLLAASMATGTGAGEPEKRIAARQGTGPCVAVDIGGQRAGHLDCAVQQLEDAARIARLKAGIAQGVSVPQAGSPDVHVGVSSLSGTRLRMGGNLGTSVHPSRPTVMPVNPLGPG